MQVHLWEGNRPDRPWRPDRTPSLPEPFGPERMLWANYYEYLIMAEMIDFFTAADRERILGGTAQRLYFR